MCTEIFECPGCGQVVSRLSRLDVDCQPGMAHQTKHTFVDILFYTDYRCKHPGCYLNPSSSSTAGPNHNLDGMGLDTPSQAHQDLPIPAPQVSGNLAEIGATRANRLWTEQELEQLRLWRSEKLPVSEIASQLGRSKHAVVKKCYLLGLSTV